MSFTSTNVNNSVNRAAFVAGLLPGLGLTYLLFTQVGWYHDLVVWSWTNPWMLLVGAAVGLGIGVYTDRD